MSINNEFSVRNYLINRNEEDGGDGGGITGLFTKSDFIFEEDPFVLECLECKQLRAKVICDFEITSPNRDVHIAVYANNDSHTKIIDESGNEYYASKVRLADKEGNRWVNKEMVKEVPISADFTFSTGEKKIKRITRMDVLFGEHNISSLKLQFRGIPVRN